MLRCGADEAWPVEDESVWRVVLSYAGEPTPELMEQAKRGRVRLIDARCTALTDEVARRVVPDLMGGSSSLCVLGLSSVQVRMRVRVRDPTTRTLTLTLTLTLTPTPTLTLTLTLTLTVNRTRTRTLTLTFLTCSSTRRGWRASVRPRSAARSYSSCTWTDAACRCNG